VPERIVPVRSGMKYLYSLDKLGRLHRATGHKHLAIAAIFCVKLANLGFGQLAVFEQLGSRALETAITVDIAGRKDAHAVSLDEEAIEAIRRERLHQKVATAVFFESNGAAGPGHGGA